MFGYFIFLIYIQYYIANNNVFFTIEVFKCYADKFSSAVDSQASEFFFTGFFGLWQPEFEGIKEFIFALEEEDL